jgi:carbonic anhydrase
MSNVEHLLANNKQWSARVRAQDPDFFARLADQQNPDYLWIGCSDSRVSANVIVDLAPGEVFVHRNVANLVNHNDNNCLFVMQFAVEVLQVEHIIVCGHYGCGGVKATLQNDRQFPEDHWLRPLQDHARQCSGLLDTIIDHAEKIDRLCELNVAEQVEKVAETPIVRKAWDRGQALQIHGWIYGLTDGLIRDLKISLSGLNPASQPN